MEIPEKIHEEFLLIKAGFENGTITKMSQLEKEKPTRIAQLTGINQGRYGSKLFEPWDFSLSEIIRIALVVNVDPGIIINIIKKELLKNELERVLRNINKIEEQKLKKIKNKLKA